MAYEFTPVKTVLRMNNLGALDEDYRKNKEGVNGVIQDAYMDEEDGVVIVGSINSFDGINVNNIVRIDKNGNIDLAISTKYRNGSQWSDNQDTL